MIRRLALLAAIGLTATVTPSAHALPGIARYCQQATTWTFTPQPTLLPQFGTVDISRSPATCFDVGTNGLTSAPDSVTTLPVNYFGTCAAMTLTEPGLFNPGGALAGVVAVTENAPGVGYLSRTDVFVFGGSPCLSNPVSATWHKVYVY